MTAAAEEKDEKDAMPTDHTGIQTEACVCLEAHLGKKVQC